MSMTETTKLLKFNFHEKVNSYHAPFLISIGENSLQPRSSLAFYSGLRGSHKTGFDGLIIL